MTNNEKLALLETTLDIEEGVLRKETLLEDLDEYDSMAKLALIVMFDEEFGVKIDSETVKSFRTVTDILNLMN